MQLLTVSSYYGTGSSAVTDFLSEFDNVKSLTNYEFRFAHDPDGLSELEYNLVDNFNRHNSGHALKRYRNLVDYYSNHFMVTRYEPFFNNKWKEISYNYIESLTDFKYKGIWQYDFYDKGPWYEFWHKLPTRILSRTIWRNKPDRTFFFGDMETFASHPTREKFIKCTKDYTDSLMKEANLENKPFVILDQLLPSSNIEHHMRYFNNVRTFVVDRDPRDLYLLAKYEWNDNIVPRDIDLFCKWFRYTRGMREVENWNPDKVMYVQFEDLIYKYDETTDNILEWIGIKKEHHVFQKKYLNPAISIKNTRYWEQHPEYKPEADKIKNELSEYLYTM